MRDRDDVDLERELQLVLADALIGPMLDANPVRICDARIMRAEGAGVPEVAGIGAAANRERLVVVSGDLVVGTDERLDLRRVRRDVEGLDRTLGRIADPVFGSKRRELRIELGARNRGRIAGIERLLEAAIHEMDHAAAAGERAELLIRAGDAQA